MKTPMTLDAPRAQAANRNGHGPNEAQLAHLRHAIEHAAHLLPAQGPITVFIHHNTLHAFEDLPFFEAVEKGAKIFGCQPYLSEDRYREELGHGRIRFADLETVLDEDLGATASEQILPFCTRRDLRQAMLQFPMRYGPTEELLWFIAETDALWRVRSDVSAAVRGRMISEARHWVMRDVREGYESVRNGNEASAHASRGGAFDVSGLLEKLGTSSIEDWTEETWEAFTLQVLWRVCCNGVAQTPRAAPLPTPSLRHRDLLLQATGEDSDLLVNDLLIRFCAAFLDQGLAHWELPRRDEGFYRSFCALYGQPSGPPDGWMRGLAAELERLKRNEIDPVQSIVESLALLGVEEFEWEDYLSATMLSLSGWAGMVRQVEIRADSVRHAIPEGSLVEFLAVRLLLERLALAYTAREALKYKGSLAGLRQAALAKVIQPEPHSTEQRAFLVFQLAQVLGWPPDVMRRLDGQEWTRLIEEIEAFSATSRRRIFHLAYECRFVTQTLDALSLHEEARLDAKARPRFQASFCLDEREESMRRHLEEVAPDVRTFGAAGFYGVAMYFRGAADAHFIPLCPIIIRPQHWVTEEVVDDLLNDHERRAKARRALGTASHRFHLGTRSLTAGALLTVGVGMLASIPLIARILFPRLTTQVSRTFSRFVDAPQTTRLRLERKSADAGPDNGSIGYSISEMGAVAERQLRDLGLTSNFARLVFFIGHGSYSLNNPHKSAYDCGACGGSPGAPNGRALAKMLNDPRIREQLARRGLKIPADTIFVGGFHNTCNDHITLFELDQIPDTHRAEVVASQRDFDTALMRNAHERCRRFMSAPLTMSFAAARDHVEGRSADLAQTRPELGHATNAICMVGRRQRTRGLYLDRRAFLTSYDPTEDDEQGTILTRLLGAAVPVCAGINLEYFFSRVDNAGFGCGTKLPHNVASLLGVMNGAASDLRTGLPWQMVEIHEPVRLVFVIETTPDVILGIMERNPGIGGVFRNGWSLLTLLDPHSQNMKVYRDGAFRDYQPQSDHLPRASSSVAWYRGWRDHLEFAEIGEPKT